MALRNITVLGKIWRFQIGTAAAVIYDPAKRRYVIALPDITGSSHYTIERGRRKKTQDGMVLPSEIRSYIESRLA